MNQDAPRRLPFAGLALVGLVLGIATALRVIAPGLTEFKNDEADAIARAALMLQGGRPIFEGAVSSTGLFNSAITAWTVLPFVAAGAGPELIVVALGLAQGFGMAVLAWQVWRLYGWPAALASLLLLGMSFWAIFVTRKVTDAAFVPLITCLFLASALQWWAFRRAWWLPVTAGLFALLVQFHVSSFVLAAPLAVLALAGCIDRTTRPLPALLAGGIFLVGWAPVWLRDALGGVNSLAILAGATDGSRRLDLAPFAMLGSVAFDGGAPYWFGDASAQAAGEFVSTGWLPAAIGLGLLLLGASALVVARRAGTLALGMRRRVPLAASEPVAAWRGLAVAMAMLVLPLAALGFRSYDLAIHYLNPFIPCAALLTGSLIGVATLQRRRWLTAVASLVLALLVVTAALQTVLVVQALRFVATTDTTNGFGIPLANQLRARDAVMTLAAGQRPDLIATAAPADQARVIEALAWPAIEAHLTRSPETLVWRPGGSTISWVHPAARNAQAWLRSEAGSDGLVVPAPGGAELLVLRAIPQPGGRIGAPLARFANGVELLQTDPATLVDGRLTVPVRWRTTQAGAPHDTRWFVHLVDRDGQLLAQADGPGWLAAAWQPGDEMISWFSMPVEIIPPGVSVRAGMAVPGAGRVAIVNARGPVVDGNALALPLDLVR